MVMRISNSSFYRGALPSMLWGNAAAPAYSGTGFATGNASIAGLRQFPARAIQRLFASTPATILASESSVSSLDEALNAIDAEKIKKDLFWVAADERGGRGTPSKGQSETADYIEKRVRELGWKSGTQDGTCRHKYQLWGGWFDVANTHLTLANAEREESFELEKDYFYTSVHKDSSNLTLDGDILFVGTPLIDVTEKYDVKDKWVVVYDSNIDPQTQRNLFYRAGAKGIIIIPGPESSGYQYERKIHAQLEHYRVDEHHLDGCPDTDCQRPIDEVMFSAEAAKRLLELLSSPEFLFQPEKENFPGLTLLHNSALQTNSVNLRDQRVAIPNPFKVNAENVAAFWEGSDPELSKEVIVLTAHYDHLGTSSSGKIYNGSDDNASGTVGLMALAEAIAKSNPKRSILLLWVSGEEKGLLGSEAWVRDYQKNPWLPNGGKLVANINMDMISRNDPTQFSITPSPRHKRHNIIVKTATALAAQEGFTKINNADRYYARSDQYNFAEILGIPVAFLTVDEHEDYHQSTDDPEKGDYDKIRRISRLFVRTINALDDVKVIE